MDVIEKEQIDPNSLAEHWYYEAKFRLLKKHIQGMALDSSQFTAADVGSGLGLFLHKMEKSGLASSTRSIGVDTAYKTPVKAFDSQILIHPEFPAKTKYDLLVLMDVLEHVENDSAVLLDSISHAEQGGYIFITVPALPALWSSHDRFLGHYRRYTLRSLKLLIESIGNLELQKLHYFYASILTVAAPTRLLKAGRTQPKSSDMRRLPKAINKILLTVCKLELQFAEHNKLGGLTAVAVCRKNGK